MDAIIKHIIDIDKKASELMKKTEDRIKESEVETKSNIEAMKSDTIGKAKTEASKLYDSIIKEAKAEVDKIHKQSMNECVALEKRFTEVEGTLTDKILHEILHYNMGDERE